MSKSSKKNTYQFFYSPILVILGQLIIMSFTLYVLIISFQHNKHVNEYCEGKIDPLKSDIIEIYTIINLFLIAFSIFLFLISLFYVWRKKGFFVKFK